MISPSPHDRRRAWPADGGWAPGEPVGTADPNAFPPPQFEVVPAPDPKPHEIANAAEFREVCSKRHEALAAYDYLLEEHRRLGEESDASDSAAIARAKAALGNYDEVLIRYVVRQMGDGLSLRGLRRSVAPPCYVLAHSAGGLVHSLPEWLFNALRGEKPVVFAARAGSRWNYELTAEGRHLAGLATQLIAKEFDAEPGSLRWREELLAAPTAEALTEEEAPAVCDVQGGTGPSAAIVAVPRRSPPPIACPDTLDGNFTDDYHDVEPPLRLIDWLLLAALVALGVGGAIALGWLAFDFLGGVR